MQMTIQLTRRAALAGLALLFAASTARAADTASPNDMALFLAGMPVAADSAMAPFTNDPAWRSHARSMDGIWKNLNARQISRIQTWSKANLSVRQPTLFYMFSGPDFLYADAFFPGATTYIMSGLEPVGRLPEPKYLNRRSVGGALGHLQNSMGSLLRVSFFQTKQMRYQLSSTQLNGTLPILYTFLARSGKTLTDVSFLTVEPDGSQKPSDGTPVRNVPNGVKISFTGDGGKAQTLYYFSTDVSNGGIKSSGFLKFCEKFAPGDAFVKSASYLMHSDNFSMVREFLVEHASALVQDDTGVPVRFFKSEDWELRPYGRYLGPIGLFSGRYQRQLSDIFRKRSTPIDFGVGYRWQSNSSNLLLATKQQRKAENGK